MNRKAAAKDATLNAIIIQNAAFFFSYTPCPLACSINIHVRIAANYGMSRGISGSRTTATAIAHAYLMKTLDSDKDALHVYKTVQLVR